MQSPIDHMCGVNNKIGEPAKCISGPPSQTKGVGFWSETGTELSLAGALLQPVAGWPRFYAAQGTLYRVLDIMLCVALPLRNVNVVEKQLTVAASDRVHSIPQIDLMLLGPTYAVPKSRMYLLTIL